MSVVRLKLEGYLTRTSLGPALLEASQALRALPPRDQATLLVDCLAMTDYEPAARSEFVRFATTNRPRILRVAIVTEKTLWHMVIRAMSLASGVEMRPFRTRVDAERYAESLAA